MGFCKIKMVLSVTIKRPLEPTGHMTIQGSDFVLAKGKYGGGEVRAPAQTSVRWSGQALRDKGPGPQLSEDGLPPVCAEFRRTRDGSTHLIPSPKSFATECSADR